MNNVPTIIRRKHRYLNDEGIADTGHGELQPCVVQINISFCVLDSVFSSANQSILLRQAVLNGWGRPSCLEECANPVLCTSSRHAERFQPLILYSNPVYRTAVTNLRAICKSSNPVQGYPVRREEVAISLLATHRRERRITVPCTSGLLLSPICPIGAKGDPPHLKGTFSCLDGQIPPVLRQVAIHALAASCPICCQITNAILDAVGHCSLLRAYVRPRVTRALPPQVTDRHIGFALLQHPHLGARESRVAKGSTCLVAIL